MKSRDDIFYEIIGYLNDNDMHGCSKLWHTEAGAVWIWYQGKWRQLWLDEANWPIAATKAMQ